ncbi:hypothetical protein SKAU_G00001000 [Synaphobranchus kaupii]|uniref:Uncharacterized protein n=1 Tax=Synaphobranchus kaupii TaxID=118154 RepID=A0A9Q1G9W3_SYNKA|nr:hypothetical protein SKAU_G00001000 [Synaphobranchus kaupii]
MKKQVFFSRCPAADRLWAASVCAPHKMADRNQDALGEAGEDTDDLLYSDLEEGVRMSGSTQAHLPRDHCDLLLDAIDAQLSRLQAQSHAVQTRGDDGNGKRTDHSSAVFIQSHSVSKDTGLGSTLPTNDTSTTPLHMGQSETQDLSSEEEDDGKGQAQRGERWQGRLKRSPSGEQCRWRLELLLGEGGGRVWELAACRADSVCTEDFAARFREEMLEPLGGVGGQEAGPGNRSSGEAHALGPGGGAKAVGTQGIGPEMEHVIPALGKMVVGVKG